MAYKVLSGTVTASDVVVEEDVPPQLFLLPAPTSNLPLKVGSSVFRKVKPNRIGKVTRMINDEIWIKFPQKPMDLPYKVEELVQLTVN